MNPWKPLYRFLVDCRNALDVLIAYARKRAFPKRDNRLAIMAGGKP